MKPVTPVGVRHDLRLVPASLLYLRRQRFQYKGGQGLDQALGILAYWRMRDLMFQVEDELRAIAISASRCCPSPSSSEDVIVRFASDSGRANGSQIVDPQG